MDEPSQTNPALPPTEEQASTETAPSAPQPFDGPATPQAAGQPQPYEPQPRGAPQPSAPFAPPTYPGMPGVPLSWGVSSTPAAQYSAPQPGVSMYPPSPEQGGPSVPAYPVYPGVPSVPLGAQGAYPTYPGYPQPYPAYPSYPQSYPGGPMMPYGAPMTVPLQQNDFSVQRALAGPFPAWLSAVVGVGAIGLVMVAFFAAVLAGQADWADGARSAGIVAIALAVIALIVAIVRGALGRRVVSMLVLSAILVVGLTAVGTTGVFASPKIHGIQASVLEGTQNWQGAINEYQLSGEQPPNAPDIARILDEQGEQQTAQGHFAAAIAAFKNVTTQYGSSGSAVGRATTDTFNAYTAWVKSQAGDVDYASAIPFFESYQTSAACTASCQGELPAIEAQALFQYGTQLLNQGSYGQAITQFETVTTQFATSSYATQAHQGAAQAYLDLAMQEKGAACASFEPNNPSQAYTEMLANYQTLLSKYADTSEGTQAKSALAAPQDVTGDFTHSVSNAVLDLSKHFDVSTGNASNDYSTILSSGTVFTFHSVALGSYYMTYSDSTGSYYIDQLNSTAPGLFPVKPLCTNFIVTIDN